MTRGPALRCWQSSAETQMHPTGVAVWPKTVELQTQLSRLLLLSIILFILLLLILFTTVTGFYFPRNIYDCSAKLIRSFLSTYDHCRSVIFCRCNQWCDLEIMVSRLECTRVLKSKVSVFMLGGTITVICSTFKRVLCHQSELMQPVMWSREHGLKTRVHSSSFYPGLGLET